MEILLTMIAWALGVSGILLCAITFIAAFLNKSPMKDCELGGFMVCLAIATILISLSQGCRVWSDFYTQERMASYEQSKHTR